MGENGREYDMPSGAKLYVSVSAYEPVMTLHDALLNELRGHGLGALDVASIQKAISAVGAAKAAQADPAAGPEEGDADAGLNVLVDRALGLAASKEFKAAIFACADKAIYKADGTSETAIQFKSGAAGYGVFDNPTYREQARGDFYAICKAVIQENMRPFLAAFLSAFAALVGKNAGSQSSSTEKGPERPSS